MRIIKFRAWYTPTKRWIDDFKIDPDGNLLIGQPIGAEWKYIAGMDYILMQSTGLTDKNGKEIYEGDIVKYGKTKKMECGVYFSPVAEESQTSKIVFDNGCFLTSEGSLGDLLKWHELEVIGNIYENV